jgi:hypothetical protein
VGKFRTKFFLSFQNDVVLEVQVFTNFFFFFGPTLFIYFYLLLLIFFLFMSNEIIETFFIFSCFGLLRQMKHQFFLFFFLVLTYSIYLFLFTFADFLPFYV